MSPTTDLFSQFVAPGVAYRGKPFWAWNGKLNRDELLRQVDVIREMGFGGFFMHSRVGLATEYLGAEWFDLINACADRAEELGLEAWLYDEDRWPSGIAGGQVTRNPEFRAHFMRLSIMPAAEFAWSADLVAAFACNLSGQIVSNSRRLSGPNDQPDLPTVLAFTVEEANRSSFYNGSTYVDTMSPAAIRYFLDLTHERYAEHCGSRLGRSIKGIFTDEPHRGALMDPFGGQTPEPEHTAPFTPRLFDEFQAAFGYDLRDHLPELFLHKPDQKVSQVKWHYVEMLQRLFLAAFPAQINSWCQDHKIEFTGHALHEDSLSAQTAMCGSMMRFYEHMGVPGVDVLSEGHHGFWVVKQLASSARQIGKRWMLSELYGCTGWQMPLAGHKAVGDWQALFGINLRCHHLSWFTMEGEAKRDYPASIFHQSAWWRDYNTVETYFARLGMLLSQGEPECDILVMNPVESVWSMVHPGWSRGLGCADPSIEALEKTYSNVFHWLAGAQLDFDYGDEEMVGRLGGVETDTQGRPLLRVGKCTYRTVVVAGMLTMRCSTAALLHRFQEAGGTVVFAGAPPTHMDAAPSDEPGKIAGSSVQVALEQDALVEACRKVSPGCVGVIDADTGESITDIFCQVRHVDGKTLVTLLNVNRERGWKNARVVIASRCASIEEWQCLSGTRRTPRHTRAASGFLVETSFGPAEERVYVISNEPSDAPVEVTWDDIDRSQLDGPFAYQLDEPNVCVLDQARWRVNGGDWSANPEEVLRIDVAVRKRFGLPRRGGDMLQPWFVAGREHPKVARLGLQYRIDVREVPQDPVTLVVERPDRLSVRINETPLDLTSDSGWWVDASMRRFPLPAGVLHPGANTIEVEVDVTEVTDLEALYLLGSFGVQLDGSSQTLVKLPATLSLGSVTDQGLPFYSGAITYLAKVGRTTAPGQRVLLALPGVAGACARVSVDGGQPLTLPWAPFEADVTSDDSTEGSVEITVVLTRRNTFGPLHQVPREATAYGPGNWHTDGKAFTYDYMLYPAGLTASPVAHRQRQRE